MRNRAYRRHKAEVKWVRRVKKMMPKTPERWLTEGGNIGEWYPDINECLDSKQFKIYKTTGKPCSCLMCSYYKYSREEFKKDTFFELKNAK
jgi:hypothetical protein